MTTVRREAKRDEPADFWSHGPSTTREIHDYRWSAVIDRGKGKQRLRADSLITDVTWDDTAAVLTGTAAFQLPNRPVDISEGHMIRFRRTPRDGGAYTEQWAMRLYKPERTLPDRTMSTQLSDDMQFLAMSIDDFRYLKDKAHPKGWLYHDIVADICRRYSIKLGRIPKGTYRIKKFEELKVSPLDAIIAAAKKEKVASGRKFVLAWRNGALVIDPLVRSKQLLVVGPQLASVSYAASIYKDGYANSISLRGTKKIGKKGHKAKLRLLVESAASIRRYGYVHTIIDSDADSLAEARTEGKTKLREAAKPERTLTLTLTNAPWIRRGQAIRFDHVDLDVKQVVFVSEARHQVTAGVHSVDATLQFDDPYTDTKAQRVRVAKTKAAAKTGRKTEAGASAAGASPTPKRAAQRAAA